MGERPATTTTRAWRRRRRRSSIDATCKMGKRQKRKMWPRVSSLRSRQMDATWKEGLSHAIFHTNSTLNCEKSSVFESSVERNLYLLVSIPLLHIYLHNLGLCRYSFSFLLFWRAQDRIHPTQRMTIVIFLVLGCRSEKETTMANPS